MGWVYLITDGIYTKIGITKNDVNTRNKQHQTGNPNPIRTVYAFRSRDMHRDETYLHRKYKDKHVNGEWYDLTDDDIDAIIKLYPDGELGEAYLDWMNRIRLWLDAVKFLIVRK